MIDGDAELRAYYLATADARVARLEEAIEDARKDQGDSARDGLRQVVHRVAGSAGTYGFAALTKTSRALESRLGPGKQLDDGTMSAAESLLDDMKRAFAAARREVQSAANAIELAPESEAASEVEIAASADDDPPARSAAPARPVPVIVTPPPLPLPSQPPAQEAPLVALFVGNGSATSAQAAARSVASALAQAGVRLLCCGEGPCLSAAAQGFAESGGNAFQLEGREDRAYAEADGVVLLRGTSFEPVPSLRARGKPVVRASTKPQEAVIELLELLVRAEVEAAA